MKTKYNLTLLIVVILMTTISGMLFYGFSGGITGKTKLSSAGCNCHGSANTNVSVEILGPSSVEVGSTNNYQVVIKNGPLVAGGVDIASNKGNLLPINSDLYLSNNELTHSGPKLPTNAQVVFDFKFVAPASPEQVTLFATGNSVNNTGGSSGDQWNYANNKIVNVIPVTSVSDLVNEQKEFNLFQNYPNPFNPHTKIKYSISNGSFVSLKIINLVGEEIETLVNEYKNPGNYSFDYSPKNLTAGIYYYILKAENKQQVRKMMYLK